MKRIRCWLRNYHRWMVPDMALIYTAENLSRIYTAECDDCGAIARHTAQRWQSVKFAGQPTTGEKE